MAAEHLLGRRWPVVVAAVVVIAGGGTGLFTALLSGPSRPAPPRSKRPAAALRVVAITPSPSRAIGYADAITVRFSAALARTTPDPTISPAVPGTWTRMTKALEFHPEGYFAPSSTVSLEVPGGDGGIRGALGQELTAPVNAAFHVIAGSVLRLQQLLAELDYLPVSFDPAGPTLDATRGADALTFEPESADLVSPSPQPGTLRWRFAKIPSQLASTFTAGEWGPATLGAVMAFESDHNLDPDGEPGEAFWATLLHAVAARDVTNRPYDYLIVTETIPETLYVWRNGHVTFETPANTGVEGAATAIGTWPVYLRFTSTTMSGTNPDGSHYVDPGIPWVSYFNGSDAVHGFIRPGYGYPQSDGCVELPIANAEQVFPLDPIGTLVTVTTGSLSSELGAAPAVTYAPPPPPPVTAAPHPTTTTVAPTTTTTAPVRHHRRHR